MREKAIGQVKLRVSWDWAIRWKQILLQEAAVNWLFIKRDLWSSLVPGLILVFVAWYSQESPTEDLGTAIAGGSLYFLLYIYTFCVANQMMGIEEDRLDKPDRPLCSGLISYRSAKIRWALSTILFSAIAWELGVFEWALLWQICVVLLNFGGLRLEWPTRHFLLGLGLMSQMGAAWQMVKPLDLVNWTWMFLVVCVSLPLLGIQDLPDIESDRAMGVNTFAVAFGEDRTRGMLFVGFLLLPILIHLGLIVPTGWNLNLLLWDSAQAIASWLVALRLLFYTSAAADRNTYLLALSWYYLVLGSASAVF